MTSAANVVEVMRMQVNENWKIAQPGIIISLGNVNGDAWRRLTNDHSPCRVLLWIVGRNCDRYQAKYPREAWDKQVDELMFRLVYAVVPLRQPDVHLVT